MLACNISWREILLFISPAGILFYFHEPHVSSTKAFLIHRNSQEELVTQTAGAWAAAGAGEQHALPIFHWWLWWQVFGILGHSLEPRDHGQTSLFLFLWCVFFGGFFLTISCSFFWWSKALFFCSQTFLVGFLGPDMAQADPSAYNVSSIIYHKTRGKAHLTPPFPWLFWHQGNHRLIMSPPDCLTVKSSRIIFFNKLLKCENDLL